MSYDHKLIEKKWQEAWKEANIFAAEDFSEKEKFYCLVEFPFPSGAGLHIGHPRSYTALDAVCRKRRMQGQNVLYPIGWDAFGLPTENYAIKTGRSPQDVTKENIDTFRKQLQSLGISFDWDREVNTTDPEYYKWTQWQFLQFFKNDMTYKANKAINWCLDCKTGLANEEVVNQACERCGGAVEKREKEQWMIAITKYADKLLADLDTVDYLDKIKKQQIDWIGKSEGATIDFALDGHSDSVTVFTTRPDTIMGATFMVLAPEHELVSKITTNDQKTDVESYIKEAEKKTDIERGDAEREKTGVFTGAYAVNPGNGEKIPVWIADYVLVGYGTGAIMAVPAHDPRDREFALKLGPIDNSWFKHVIHIGGPIDQTTGHDGSSKAIEEVELNSIIHEGVRTGRGRLINSGEFNDLSTGDAAEKIAFWLEEKGLGKKTTNFKLRDWVFSRQRYWGEPIPLIHCEGACSPETDGWIAVPDKDLPVVLPVVEKYEPRDDGESPLAQAVDWVNTTCPSCGGVGKRETDTMPNWAGSSWYFLRYIDPNNSELMADPKKLDYWMPVDWYNGGMEHTTLHLLYSRFWNKFLHSQGHVPTSEPYTKRTSHGLILADDGTKMSKSKGNVINPDEIVESHGADSLRVYEAFIGPFSEPVPWSTNGLSGVRRFLDKVNRMQDLLIETETEAVTRTLHQTIKKVSDDIEAMRFNTAISQMMTFGNVVQTEGGLTKESMISFLKLLCPFAPHITNEIAEHLGHEGFLESSNWPVYDESLVVESEMTIAIQVNGKLRGDIQVPADATEETIIAKAKEDENVTKYLEEDIKKTIYVPGKLVNFVV